MKRSFKIILALFCILVISCNNKSSNLALDSSNNYYNNDLDAVIPEEAIKDQNNDEISRKLIKNGSIRFRTSSIEKTKAAVIVSVKKYNGYISDENTSTEGKRNTISINVRVPSDNFDALLEDIESQASKTDYKNLYVEDITQEFIDVETRLKTKKELEERYLELLKDAKSVTEIMEIEKQINILRSEIESTEGRLRYLSKQVDYSTLNITFYDYNQNFGFTGKFENGIKSGWTNLLWLIVALANLWAIILFFVIIWFVSMVVYRRRTKRKYKELQQRNDKETINK